MCCNAAKWKREEVADHKFDFVDVHDFVDKSLMTRLKYAFLFVLVIKSILVYVADLWTLGLLIASNGWSTSIPAPYVDVNVAAWVFGISIASAFVLLGLEWRKTARVIKSRDIAYAFTSVGAYRFYSLRSFPHFGLFQVINDNESLKEKVAFFCYFTLKGWKRFLFAEAPRQVIRALILYSVYFGRDGFRADKFWNTSSPLSERTTVVLTTFSFVVWAITAIKLTIAFVAYLFLLCAIRGNLKEYVCHKIDKRISNILKQKSKKRILEEQRKRKLLERQLRAQAAAAPPELLADPNATSLMQLVGFREPTLPKVAEVDNPEAIPIIAGREKSGSLAIIEESKTEINPLAKYESKQDIQMPVLFSKAPVATTPQMSHNFVHPHQPQYPPAFAHASTMPMHGSPPPVAGHLPQPMPPPSSMFDPSYQTAPQHAATSVQYPYGQRIVSGDMSSGGMAYQPYQSVQPVQPGTSQSSSTTFDSRLPLPPPVGGTSPNHSANVPSVRSDTDSIHTDASAPGQNAVRISDVGATVVANEGEERYGRRAGNRRSSAMPAQQASRQIQGRANIVEGSTIHF